MSLEIMESELKELAVTLFEINVLKFGDFVTKTGLKTPVYCDLRVIISYPRVLEKLSKLLWKFAEESDEVLHICGIPYTALPIATIISVHSNLPLLLRRKEIKSYGTKKLIEGQFNAGERCIVIEDVITSGSSILETVNDLRHEGLKVTEAFVVIDREQGAKQNLENNGIKVKSLYTLTKFVKYLLEAGKITADVARDVSEFVKTSQVSLCSTVKENRLKLDFASRALLAKNSVASKLLQLMASKETTLCLAADVLKTDSVLELADLAGPHIAVLKTHVDILDDFHQEFIERLKKLAVKHEFLLMEDRKFGDIGHTVSLQYRGGMYKIAKWADLVTVHSIAGASIIAGLEDALSDIPATRGIFLISEMSVKDNLIAGDYVRNSVSIAESSNLVAGLVCQSNVFSNPGLIQLTPGVKLTEISDNLGQQYSTPELVVNSGADLAVVGRGITEADDKLAAVLRYKQQLWTAYKKRIGR